MIFKEWKKLLIKVDKIKEKLHFLGLCRKEGVIPKTLKVRIPRQFGLNRRKLEREFGKRLLSEEMKFLRRLLNQNGKQLENLRMVLRLNYRSRTCLRSAEFPKVSLLILER